jgi:hypothetical protein
LRESEKKLLKLLQRLRRREEGKKKRLNSQSIRVLRLQRERRIRKRSSDQRWRRFFASVMLKRIRLQSHLNWVNMEKQWLNTNRHWLVWKA